MISSIYGVLGFLHACPFAPQGDFKVTGPLEERNDRQVLPRRLHSSAFSFSLVLTLRFPPRPLFHLPVKETLNFDVEPPRSAARTSNPGPPDI